MQHLKSFSLLFLIISLETNAYEKYSSQKEAGDLLYNEVIKFKEINGHYPEAINEISLSGELKSTLKKEHIEYFTFETNGNKDFSVKFDVKFSLVHCYKGSNDKGDWMCFLRK